MNSFIKLLLFLVNCLAVVKNEKILAVFPFPGPSQYIVVQPYLKALAANGHEVSVINAFPQKQPIKNFRNIPVMEVHENYKGWLHHTTDLKCDNALIFKQFSLAVVDSIKTCFWELHAVSTFVGNISETVLINPSVQKLLKEEHFDLIIMEALHMDALYSLARYFQAPLIGVSSFGNDPIIDELMGNISPLSYVPLKTLELTEEMTFKERLRNVVHSLLAILYERIWHIPNQKILVRKFLPNIKDDLWEMRTNFSLMLLNQHFSISFPRPYVPAMVEVGGFHIQHQPSPLPHDVERFINSSKQDIIYFSMGSNIRSTDFSSSTLLMFNEVFKSLPYLVLWKFEDAHLPNKPNNVFIKSWFPQPDILAHSRVKLFISHGGLLSTIETIHHGKPMLGIPVFFDQKMNIRKAVASGYALSIDFNSLSKETLRKSIVEMMTNVEYKETVEEISTIYHDQPMKPLDRALFWTEYVIKHRGAIHLQAKAQKMGFIQKHSIDTLSVLFITFILILYSVAKMIRAVFKLILNKSAKKHLKIN